MLPTHEDVGNELDIQYPKRVNRCAVADPVRNSGMKGLNRKMQYMG